MKLGPKIWTVATLVFGIGVLAPVTDADADEFYTGKTIRLDRER